MIGQTIAHYKVTAKLGAGGMGEVYRATDSKLGRDVALKFLPADVAANPQAMERFRREARAASALNHSSICTIYEIGEHEGSPFMAMELLEGQTLKQFIESKSCDLEALINFSIQIADALATAHAKGIIHRDIKPSNLFVTDCGQAKMLDFGLAKIEPTRKAIGPGANDPTQSIGADQRELTIPGHAIGTIAYMSPEQALGKELDARTDLFSFGVVLYEMATGLPPFHGETSAAIFNSILNKAPVSPLRLNRTLPAKLEEIINKALEKEPGLRYQHASDVLADLQRLKRDTASRRSAIAEMAEPGVLDARSPGRSAVAVAIAVLPFADLSPTKDQDWFCEGIAEEILNSLSKLPGLRVASRTSAFRFKDPARDARKIGEALGVTTLLEGSLRTAGSQLRVTAQLVNAQDGYQLWSERFDRRIEDVFSIQDEIATKVVQALKVRLGVSSAAPTPARQSVDLEAYQQFLKARHFRYSKLDLRGARRAFERAIQRDPSYALARVGLAETLLLMGIYGLIPPAECQAGVRGELKKARELDGETAAGIAVEASIALVHDWDTPAALSAFERALELDPSSIFCRGWYSWALLAAGRVQEAVNEARRFGKMDAQSPYAHAMTGLTLLLADLLEEAVAHERRALELQPKSLQATWLLALALAARSDWDEALEWFGRAVDRSSRGPFHLGLLAWCQAASGQHDRAQQSLTELEERSSREYISPFLLAWGYGELGDQARARKYLQDAFQERSLTLVHQGMPTIRKLRNEPLMEDLRRRLLGQGAGATE